MSRNVIMHVLFSAAAIAMVPVHRFLAHKSCILINEGEIRLTLLASCSPTIKFIPLF